MHFTVLNDASMRVNVEWLLCFNLCGAGDESEVTRANVTAVLYILHHGRCIALSSSLHACAYFTSKEVCVGKSLTPPRKVETRGSKHKGCRCATLTFHCSLFLPARSLTTCCCIAHGVDLHCCCYSATLTRPHCRGCYFAKQ